MRTLPLSASSSNLHGHAIRSYASKTGVEMIGRVDK